MRSFIPIKRMNSLMYRGETHNYVYKGEGGMNSQEIVKMLQAD